MNNKPIGDNGALRHHDKLVEVMSKELFRAFKTVETDLRCFDWLCYNPDFFASQKRVKAA